MNMSPNSAEYEVFQMQLKELKERMEKGFEDVKTLLRSFDERVRSVENNEAKCQPVLTTRVDLAWHDLDEHALSIKDLTELANAQAITITKVIEAQKHLNTLLKWGLGIITAVITVFVVALMTGQAYLVFK
jgi:hypothetical protein